jgi:hypothetical protein
MLLKDKTAEIALGEKGVKEVGKNAGPRVEVYLRCVGLGPGYAWCAAFVSWCVEQAFKAVGLGDGLVGPMLFRKSAGALALFHVNAPLVVPRGAQVALPCIGVEDHGGGLGHVYIILAVHPDGTLDTIEGNTNEAGSREGNAVVHKLGKRRLADCVGLLKIG